MKIGFLFACIIILSPVCLFAQPIISSFTPVTGPIGTSITISGSNFSATPTDNIVYFGAVRATVTTSTSTSLNVVVPVGATYQPITVTVNNLTGYSHKPFGVTFSGGMPIANYSGSNQNVLEAKLNVPTDLHPNGVAISDFDGDGKPDMATPNNYSTTGSPASVSILRNTSSTGSLSFAPKEDIATGVMTYAVAAGDLDGDGKPDLVSSSIVDKTISIFKNTSSIGSIRFAPKIDMASGVNPNSITIADFDKDGKPDIAVANQLSNSISIYRNTSSGAVLSFATKVDYLTALMPSTIASGDFDGDGKVDLAVTNELSNSFSIFKNISTSGGISFATKTDFATVGKPIGLAVGDINGDGLLDVVVTGNTINLFSVYRNTSGGNITFASKVDFVCGASPYGISLDDMNGDGKVDFLIASDNCSVHQNNSSGSTIATSGVAYTYLTLSPFIVSAGDFDGDGKSDLAAAIFTSSWVSVLRNKNNEPSLFSISPTAGWAGTTLTLTGVNFSGVTALSIGGVPVASFTIINATTITAVVPNGAASGDVTVTNQYGTSRLSGFVYYGAPTITSFSPTSALPGGTVTITGTNFYGVTAVSFGGVAATSYTVTSPTTITAAVASGASGNVSVTTPGGTATLVGFTYTPPPSITSFSPASAATGTTVTITGLSLNGATSVSFGGTPALSFTVVNSTTISAVVAGGSSGNVSVTTPVGTTQLSGYAFLPVPPPIVNSFSPQSGAVSTLVTILGTNFSTILSNNIVFFGAVRATVTTATPTSLTVLVPKGATYQPISVLNATTGLAGRSSRPFNITFVGGTIDANSFAATQNYPAADAVSSTTLCDIDGDGRAEIIAVCGTSFSTAKLSIFRNTSTAGNLSFAPRLDILATYSAWHVITSDVDGDGWPDLVVANNNTPTVSFFRNTSTLGIISFAAKIDVPMPTAPLSVMSGDIDDDGKPDIIVGGFASFNVLRNTSMPGVVSFANQIRYLTGSNNGLEGVGVNDLDGDGKLDVVVAQDLPAGRVSFYKNQSTLGNILFSPKTDFPMGNSPDAVAAGDLNNDGKPEIIGTSKTEKNVSILTNIGTSGALTFSTPINQLTGLGVPNDIALNDMNGDGRLDIVVPTDGANVGGVSVLGNNTGLGAITIGLPITYNTGNGPSDVALGDIDGDGMPDIVTGNLSGSVSVLRNKLKGDLSTCLGSNITLESGKAGVALQWQVNTGTGFTNISNGGNYVGTTTDKLGVNNVPSNFNGYQFRCVVDGTNSNTYILAVDQILTLPTISASGTTTFCSGGSVTLTSSATTGNQWYKDGIAVTGQNSQTYFVSQSGNYSVQVNNKSCTSAMSVAISVTVNNFPPSPTVSANGPTSICSGGSVSLLSTASSGNQWFLNGNLISGATSQTYAATQIGNYSVTTTQNGCSSNSSNSVNIINTTPIAIPTISASPSATVCAGTPVTLIANSTACSSCTYAWNGGAASTNSVLVVNSSGLNQVAVNNGCATVTASIQVTSTPVPNLTISSSALNVCSGTGVQLTAAGATTYVWSPPSGLSNTTSATVTATLASTTTYTVTGTTNSCSANKSVAITVQQYTAPAIAISYSGCGAGALLFTSSILNGGINPTIEWYVNNVLAGTGPSYTLNNAVNGTQVYAKLTSSITCVIPQVLNSATSTVNCLTTSLPTVDGVEGFVVSPNPSTGLLTVKMKLLQRRKVSFQIINSFGEVIYKSEPANMIGTVYKRIDLRGNPKGVYYVRTSIGDNDITEKVIVI